MEIEMRVRKRQRVQIQVSRGTGAKRRYIEAISFYGAEKLSDRELLNVIRKALHDGFSDATGMPTLSE